MSAVSNSPSIGNSDPEGNDMTQDSKPKPQVRKSADVQKAALEYLRILRISNPGYDVNAAKSVVVVNRK